MIGRSRGQAGWVDSRALVTRVTRRSHAARLAREETYMVELVTDVLASEYDTLVAEAGEENTDARLVEVLVRDAEWTEAGAQTLVWLARTYGTSILRNALCLASSLRIEDGEAGL